MRIGIDCRQVYDVQKNAGAGVARYIFHLVENLLSIDQRNEFVLFCHGDIGSETTHRIKGSNARVKIVKVFRTKSRIPLWTNHIKFARVLRREKLDWAIFPANIVPLFYFGKALLVIHDLAIYLHPEWFPAGQWLARRVLVPASVRKAKAVVCVSENTRRDLLALFQSKPSKIFAVYPGVTVRDDCSGEDADNVTKKYHIGTRYVFYIGTIEPRKNLANLLKAFSNYTFTNDEEEVNLVLAGAKGWKCQPVFRELTEANGPLVDPRVKYLGKISDSERNILLKNCAVFVYPSYYEGFGFPVAEAMALGAPVITSDNSSLREIAEGAAVLINPDDVDGLTAAIERVLRDKVLRYQLVNAGRERVKIFNWRQAAMKILQLLK